MADRDLRASAIVFSPHPDDETLGCGGTVVHKVRAGAEVAVVFMTDGSASHRGRLPGDELKRLRSAEARVACQTLGIGREQVVFLDFKDGDLESARDEAIGRTVDILDRLNPSQVFIPCAEDDTPDHLATRAIVTAAVLSRERPVDVYEYPIWFWNRWPWTPKPPTRSMRQAAKLTYVGIGSWLRLAIQFRFFVTVGEVLHVKRAALASHRTQTTRLGQSQEWPILEDVADGAFLECFFRPYEVFRRYSLGGRVTS